MEGVLDGDQLAAESARAVAKLSGARFRLSRLADGTWAATLDWTKDHVLATFRAKTAEEACMKLAIACEELDA